MRSETNLVRDPARTVDASEWMDDTFDGWTVKLGKLREPCNPHNNWVRPASSAFDEALNMVRVVVGLVTTNPSYLMTMTCIFM